MNHGTLRREQTSVHETGHALAFRACTGYLPRIEAHGERGGVTIVPAGTTPTTQLVTILGAVAAERAWFGTGEIKPSDAEQAERLLLGHWSESEREQARRNAMALAEKAVNENPELLAGLVERLRSHGRFP